MERSVHAFFYQKMSDVMNIDPAETAEIQETVVALKDKLQMLKQITKRLSDDKVLGLATIACIEQVLLFSNFAMLKSFKANGHNMMKNTLTGVDFVIRDEQIHGDYAAYLHNTYIEESKSFDFANHIEQVFKVLEEIISHEDAVIDFVFEGAESINDITPQQLKTFARSRANHLLENLGMPSKYEIESNAISDWFYQGVKSIKVHDFFAASTQQYKRTWKFDNFSLKNIKGVK
jgi:ribonucleotide reductase beta subunit family protein with ferritin-like domain